MPHFGPKSSDVYPFWPPRTYLSKNADEMGTGIFNFLYGLGDSFVVWGYFKPNMFFGYKIYLK